MFDSNKDGSLTREEFTQAVQYFCGLDQEERQYECKCSCDHRLAWGLGEVQHEEARHGQVHGQEILHITASHCGNGQLDG